MRKFKVCLVGCGVIAPRHLTALQLVDGAEIVALCDIDENKAKQARDLYAKNASIYTDYQTMLFCEKPDAVHITTPHYLHCEMALTALSKNIHVFLEKPMCINEEEIEKLLEAEKISKGRICVCFQNRFNPTTIKALEILESDGGALAGYGSVFWTRTEKYYTESGWRGKYATEGGGVMINQAIHTIDLLNHVLGVPCEVCATTSNHHLKGTIEVEDTCEGLIKYTNGKQANFYATTSFLFKDSTTAYFVTKNHTVKIEGQYLYLDGKTVEGIEKYTNPVGKECYGSGHFHIIPKFYEALDSGAPMPVTLESASLPIKIILAAYKSKDNHIKI